MPPTIGILSPGEMGSEIGRVLKTHGLQVIVHTADRSERTQNFARSAGLEEVESFDVLIVKSDLLLSVMPPDQAMKVAGEVTDTLEKIKDTGLIYVDCNAIAPETSELINDWITSTGNRYVDASIIGPPPREPGHTRIYVSGLNADSMIQLNGYGLEVISLGRQVGKASAIKMCYAAMTKGISALLSELMIAAHALQVDEALLDEFHGSQGVYFQRIQRTIPRVPRKARRFAGEMDEIARTFEAVGLTPRILQGAADMYRFLGQTPLADTFPEDPTPPPSLEEALDIFSRFLPDE